MYFPRYNSSSGQHVPVDNSILSGPTPHVLMDDARVLSLFRSHFLSLCVYVYSLSLYPMLVLFDSS